jgi:MFS family permease
MANTDTYAPLKVRDFRFFILSRLALTMAFQMTDVVVQWQVYALTHDKLALGLMGLAEALPNLAISLYAGHIVDRYSRKNVGLAAITVSLSISIILAFVSHNVATIYPAVGIIPFYVAAGIGGLASGFASPALFALISETIPKALYAKASAWSSSTWQTGAIIGPAIGGLLFWLIGPTKTYATSGSLILIAITALALIKNRHVPVERKENESVAKNLGEGLRFVFRNQIIFGALSLDLFAVLFGGAIALLPVFASDILFVGPQGLGILRAAPSVGAVIMALVLAHRDLRGKVGYQLLGAVFGFGLCMIVFALSRNFVLSLIVLLVSGALDSVSVIIRSTILQVRTPNAIRGRVASVNLMFIGSSNELGAFESGVAAKLMGTIPSVIFGGCMTLLTVVGAAIFAPKLREMDARELKEESPTDSSNSPVFSLDEPPQG